MHSNHHWNYLVDVHKTQLMRVGLGCCCFTLAGVAYKMCRCYVRCMKAKILLAICQCYFPEALKPPLTVPHLVHVNVAKKIHILHGLWIYILGWYMSMSDVSLQICRNHIWCVKTLDNATCRWPKSPHQFMEATADVALLMRTHHF